MARRWARRLGYGIGVMASRFTRAYLPRLHLRLVAWAQRGLAGHSDG